MDYKQKYEEALERAKMYQGMVVLPAESMIETIFPELRESEDEMIRKRIIQAIKIREKEMNEEWSNEIAWLEKQGEHANFRNKIQIGDKVTRNKDGVLVNLSQLNRVAKKDEKQGEQNHSEQDLEMVAKPKFNIGDWITSNEPYINNDYRLCKVVGISDGCYTIQTINGLKGYNTFKGWESEYHLWSIKDAKDGDVLVASDESLFIFARVKDNSAYYHYSLCKNGSQEISDGKHSWETASGSRPATKEQRDILFQKMHEAGYEWDADEKELKKAKKAPQKFIVGDTIKYNGTEYKITEITPNGYKVYATIYDEDAASLISFSAPAMLVEQNSDWSEDDKNIISDAEVWLDTLCDYLKDSSSECIPHVKNVINRLNTIKNRIVPQTKQESFLLNNIWKSADNNELPEIDREVIALLEDGKVVFAHRPPEYWDGKNIITNEVTRYYPKRYGGGGWNQPNVKWWLDLDLPKMEE